MKAMRPLRPNPNESGMVLVMTMLVLSILIVMSYALSFSASVNLRASRNIQTAFREETGAESALNYALAILRADAEENDFDTLDEAWANAEMSVTVDGVAYDIRIVDEDRKLNVNRAVFKPADPEEAVDLQKVLERLIGQLDGEPRDAQALCAWIDPNVPGIHDRIAPKHAVPMIEGLRAILDLNPDLFEPEGDVPALDEVLATHPNTININTAMEPILKALLDDAAMVSRIVDQRAESPFKTRTDMVSYLKTILPDEEVEKFQNLLDVKSDFYAVTVRGPGSIGLTALVKRQDKATYVLNIRRVSEDIPQ